MLGQRSGGIAVHHTVAQPAGQSPCTITVQCRVTTRSAGTAAPGGGVSDQAVLKLQQIQSNYIASYTW